MKRNYFMRKRIQPLAIFGLMFVFGMFFWNGASAVSFGNVNINPLYLDYVNDVQNGEGSKWTIIPSMYLPRAAEEGYGAGGDLPAAFNLVEEGYATQIKNQGSDGICWAYALTTAMESNLLKTHNLREVFSAKQMDYLTAPGVGYYEYIYGLFGDYYDRTLGGGSSFGAASFALSNASIPADESGFFAEMQANDASLERYRSYGEFEDYTRMSMILNYTLNEPMPSKYTEPMTKAQITGTKSDYYVSDYTRYYATTANVNDIKNDVYNNGAVYVETFAPGTSNCYDYTTNTVVDRGADVCGEAMHAMAIVGWDDNHTYTDPADGSQKQGAFIMQNSWGNSDLFVDYGVTYEYLVSTGVIDPSELTEDEIIDIKEAIAEYDAFEFVYLAYDFERSDDNKADIGFASVSVDVNNFGYVSDLLDDIEGLGSSSEAGSGEIIYTYDAGEETKRIEAISVEMRIFVDGVVSPGIYVDNGNGWVLFGTVTIPKNVSVKRTAKATKSVDVTGVYKVKVDFSDVENMSDYYELVSTTVYANDAPAQDPDEPGGNTPSGPSGEIVDDDDEETIKVPDTGLLTWWLGGAHIVVPTLMVIAGFGFVAYKVYANRKEIFHKVKFDKK